MMPFFKNNCPKTKYEFFEESLEEEGVKSFKCLISNYKKYIKSDKCLNIFLGDTTVKIIRIVSDLTKALENLISKLELLSTKNSEFRVEIDRLKAMLKVRSGKFTEYQKSVSELNDLGIQLTKEASELKSTFDENELNRGADFSQSYKKISALDSLMKKVQDKLNSDYEALLAAGSPDFADYLKQIADLNAFSKSLQEELRRLETAFRLKLEFKNSDHTIILQETNHLQELINRVTIDIEKLRSTPLRIGCRIGGEDCNQYLEEMLILIEIVQKSQNAVKDLKNSIGTDEMSCKKKISELEILSKRLQFEMKKLEMVVASGDNSSLIKRIKELEDSISRLKQELTEKEDSAGSLQQELTGAKIAFRQKVRDLEVVKSKVRTLADEVKLARQEVEGKDQQIVKLLYQLETQNSSVIRQRYQCQLNSIKPTLHGIRAEKDNALKEIEVIRNFLLEGVSEISKVLGQKSGMEEELKTELQELREENAGLKSSMQLLKQKETARSDKQSKEYGNSGPVTLIENVEKENRNLKVLLKKATEEVDRVNRTMEDLKNQNEDETANLKLKLDEMMTSRDQLKLDVQIEKTTTKETLKAFDKLSTERDELEQKIKILEDEKEGLSRNCRDAVEECSVCRNQLEGLRKEAFHQREYETTLKSKMSSLTEELVSTRKELEAANSRNTSLEKDLELIAVRVEDLGRENDDLRGGLNKAEIERQKLADELSKWREENRLNETHLKTRTDELNEMKSQNTRLQQAHEAENTEAKRKIELLKKQNSVLENESRHFESQLFVLREEIGELGKADSKLKKEKEKLECDLDKLKEEFYFIKSENEKCQIELEKQRNAKESFESDKIQDEILEERKKFEIVIQTLKAEVTDIQKNNLETQLESKKELEARNEQLKLKQDEFQILDIELSETRNENESLRRQLEEFKNNILTMKEEQNKLRNDNEEITSINEIQLQINLSLQKKLKNSLKENDKLEITKIKLNELDPKLKVFYKDYSAMKKSLHVALEQIKRLEQEKIDLLKKRDFKERSHVF